ncbi:hypothetical protein E3N88_17778 [Mikania micrantha]|uniref:Uncharacterized protein n=1 Tax=Mikania micrantha TaxID=192012 RepID=A0A5N6NST1_9ASTR|nr:hypothetical protein E3N88_17778 [Mikania micrantha]
MNSLLWFSHDLGRERRDGMRIKRKDKFRMDGTSLMRRQHYAFMDLRRIPGEAFAPDVAMSSKHPQQERLCRGCKPASESEMNSQNLALCDQVKHMSKGGYKTEDRTAGDKPEEGEDDVKSSCPLCPGRHTCYNGRDKGSRSREAELTPKTRPQFGLQAATCLHEAGIASNRRSAIRR